MCFEILIHAVMGSIFIWLQSGIKLYWLKNLLVTDSMQVGYKKRNSTLHAFYSLKECTDYFTNGGSSVKTALFD